MELTIFAKQRQTKDGRKTFFSYLTRLTNKNTGETVTASVKFREMAGDPDPRECPMNIKVERGAVNLDTKEVPYERDGQSGTIIQRTLWVSEWEPGTPYVDTSMDDYM